MYINAQKKKTGERNQSHNSKSVYIKIGDFDVGFQYEAKKLSFICTVHIFTKMNSLI